MSLCGFKYQFSKANMILTGLYLWRLELAQILLKLAHLDISVIKTNVNSLKMMWCIRNSGKTQQTVQL